MTPSLATRYSTTFVIRTKFDRPRSNRVGGPKNFGDICILYANTNICSLFAKYKYTYLANVILVTGDVSNARRSQGPRPLGSAALLTS